MNKFLSKIMAISALAMLGSSDFGSEHTRRERPDTSNIGGGYSHSGIYSQQKKLRKGAGKRKLTRAQRRKFYEKQIKK